MYGTINRLKLRIKDKEEVVVQPGAGAIFRARKKYPVMKNPNPENMEKVADVADEYQMYVAYEAAIAEGYFEGTFEEFIEVLIVHDIDITEDEIRKANEEQVRMKAAFGSDIRAENPDGNDPLDSD